MQIDRNWITSPRVTYRNEKADVAVLALGRLEPESLDTRPYHPTSWPPRVPSAEDTVYFSGYPRVLRRDGAHGPPFADFSATVPVTSVTPERITCQFRRENWINAGYGEIPPQGTELGGMSGAPVFLMSRLHYPLVGIITDFSPAFDLMNIALLDRLPSLEKLVGAE